MGLVRHRDKKDATISRPSPRRLTAKQESAAGLYTHQVGCYLHLPLSPASSIIRSNFVVWISAALNQHYLVALATIIGLLALVFQPVASAIFSTKPTYITYNRECNTWIVECSYLTESSFQCVKSRSHQSESGAGVQRSYMCVFMLLYNPTCV